MEIRPCFSSVALRRLKASTSPSAVKPTGSQKPVGLCTPNSFSNAQKPPGAGALPSHISGPVVPVVPFWKNMAIMAVMANLEFAISDWSFLNFSSGSSDERAVQPSCPGLPSFQSLPKPLWYSTKRQYPMI